MGGELVVRDPEGSPNVSHTGGVLAEDVSAIHDYAWLVEGDPVLDPVTQAREHDGRIFGEPIRHRGVGPAAQVLQVAGQIPVVQSHIWRNVRFEQCIDEAVVEVETRLVDASPALRQHPRPCRGHAIALDAQALHKRNVLWITAIVLAGQVPVVPTADVAGCVGEAVPDRRARAVRQWVSLDLVGRCGGPPYKVFRKSQ